MDNPFIKKAQERTARQQAQAKINYRELQKVFAMFGPGDSPTARERVRKRVVEAREAMDRNA